MSFGNQMFPWRAFMYLCVFLILFYQASAYCDYAIENLSRQRPNPTDNEVYSSMDIGTRVFTAILVQYARKRGIFEQKKDAILLVTNSSNYELIFSDGYHEVVVKSCLQAGHRENLEFSLNETIPYADCGVWILETHVEPSKPNFTIPSSVNVNVSSCLSNFDVIDLMFENGGHCSNWICYVNCTNDAKIFWTEGNTVRTSVDNINFNFTYAIQVTCFDETAGSLIGDTTDDALINVTFVDTAGACTGTSQTTATTLSTMSSSEESTGISGMPGNVASLAFYGEVILGIPIGVLLSCLLYHM